jgi:hypothetical protein
VDERLPRERRERAPGPSAKSRPPINWTSPSIGNVRGASIPTTPLRRSSSWTSAKPERYAPGDEAPVMATVGNTRSRKSRTKQGSLGLNSHAVSALSHPTVRRAAAGSRSFCRACACRPTMSGRQVWRAGLMSEALSWMLATAASNRSPGIAQPAPPGASGPPRSR